MNSYITRILKIVSGLFLAAVGIYLNIQANIGLAPWDAFSIGLASFFGVTFGTVYRITGIMILFIIFISKEKIGVGTILNSILLGSFVDLLFYFNFILEQSNFFVGVVMLFIGINTLALGTYLYMSAGMGCGPRDTLMIVLGKLFKPLRIGITRGVLEAIVVFVGWVLGAKIGLGTIIYVVFIGLSIDIVFNLFKFNSTNIVHESILESIKYITTN